MNEQESKVGVSHSGGVLDYYFRSAPRLPSDPSMVSRLDSLAVAMMDAAAGDPLPPRHAAIYPLFVDFILNDIYCSRDSLSSPVDAVEVEPSTRRAVADAIANRRSVRLDLETVYGGGIFDDVAPGVLRDPGQSGRLRIGNSEQVGGLRGGWSDDLPRHGMLEDRGEGWMAGFADAAAVSGEVSPFRAVIPDRRNDWHLGLAQIHVAFLRQHNRAVEYCRQSGLFLGNGPVLENRARAEITHCYRWLIRADLLPKLCDPATLQQVIAKKAPLLREMRRRSGRRALPLETLVALEFIVLATTPGSLDWNRHFGRDAKASGGDEATLRDLFSMSGEAVNPMNGLSTCALPSIWSVDWLRMTQRNNPQMRAISASVTPALKDAASRQVRGKAGAPVDPLRRALRLAWRFDLPSGQACLDALNDLDVNLDPLSMDELSMGTAGAALVEAGLARHTPLGFYLLREAEARCAGRHLGPLGTWLVADMIVGLLDEVDPQRAWEQERLPLLAGSVIDSLAEFLRIAGEKR